MGTPVKGGNKGRPEERPPSPSRAWIYLRGQRCASHPALTQLRRIAGYLTQLSIITLVLGFGLCVLSVVIDQAVVERHGFWIPATWLESVPLHDCLIDYHSVLIPTGALPSGAFI